MKFVWNFILFGIIFFLIHKFFPTAFETVFSWTDQVYGIIEKFVMALVAKIQAALGSGGNGS